MSKQQELAHKEASAKALQAARRKNAAASFTARYQELDRLTGMDATERAKQLVSGENRK